MISVSAILAGSGEDIIVELTRSGSDGEGKEKCIIPISLYTELQIKKGESSRELCELVLRESEIYSAFKRGLYILGFGFCSKNMLLSKLVQKGFDREVSRQAVDRISERGYLDECANALREAERCVAKLWGQTRIKATLQQKRYSYEAIESATFALEDGGVDFDENCKRLIASRYPHIPEDRAQMQKLIATVCRMGYSVSQIKSAAAELLCEQKKPNPYK